MDYVENSAQPVFLGKTTSDNNYQLVSQSNGSYVGCTLSLNNNAVSGSCPGLTKQVLNRLLSMGLKPCQALLQ